MDYTVAISDSLCPSREGLIAAWNSDASSSEVAVAREPAAEREDFIVPLIGAVLVVLGTVATGVGTNAVYDLLKSQLKRVTGKKVAYRVIEMPDGTKITEFFEP